jgi:hypothetical protein
MGTVPVIDIFRAAGKKEEVTENLEKGVDPATAFRLAKSA